MTSVDLKDAGHFLAFANISNTTIYKNINRLFSCLQDRDRTKECRVVNFQQKGCQD
jgi:hypothetical protein